MLGDGFLSAGRRHTIRLPLPSLLGWILIQIYPLTQCPQGFCPGASSLLPLFHYSMWGIISSAFWDLITHLSCPNLSDDLQFHISQCLSDFLKPSPPPSSLTLRLTASEPSQTPHCLSQPPSLHIQAVSQACRVHLCSISRISITLTGPPPCCRPSSLGGGRGCLTPISPHSDPSFIQLLE